MRERDGPPVFMGASSAGVVEVGGRFTALPLGAIPFFLFSLRKMKETRRKKEEEEKK